MKIIGTIFLFLLISQIIFISCGNSGSKRGSKSISSNSSHSNNDKKTFLDFFKFEPSPDVKNFHYYPDEVGIDASYWISFECDPSTVEKIKETLHLTESPIATEGLSGGLNVNPSPWWDTAFIYKSKPFEKQEGELYWYLWYNESKKKVYFLTFDV